MSTLPELLADAGFAPGDVKVLRHDQRGVDAWKEGPDHFLSFVAVQFLETSPFRRDPPYVAHFLSGPKLSSGGYSAVFVGMTRLFGRWPWDDARLPRTWVRDYREDPTRQFEASDQARVETAPPLTPGLVIDWGMSPRSWHQWGVRPKAIVMAADAEMGREEIAQSLGSALLSEEMRHLETLAYEERSLKAMIARIPDAIERGFAERRLAAVQPRPNQARFRNALIQRHGGVCCITNCDVPDALEAAHIVPFSKGTPDRDMPSNGLLLRRDIHRLFDLLRLSVDPETHTVWLDTTLRNGAYKGLMGASLDADVARPALAAHFRRARAIDTPV